MAKDERDWWVSVHTEKHGPYSDHASAFNAAKALKRAQPHKHVAVVAPNGISTAVD
jgi:hypothetical protein